MLTQNIIKLRAAVHELSCAQRKKLGRKQYSPSLALSGINCVLSPP